MEFSGGSIQCNVYCWYLIGFGVFFGFALYLYYFQVSGETEVAGEVFTFSPIVRVMIIVNSVPMNFKQSVNGIKMNAIIINGILYASSGDLNATQTMSEAYESAKADIVSYNRWQIASSTAKGDKQMDVIRYHVFIDSILDIIFMHLLKAVSRPNT